MAKKRHVSVLIGMLGVALIAGLWFGQRGSPAALVTTGRPSQQETETPTPESTEEPVEVYEPILTAQDAISRSLQVLRPDQTVTETLVARMPITVAYAWAGMEDPSADLDLAAWVVGFRVDNLRYYDVVSLAYFGYRGLDDPNMSEEDRAIFAENDRLVEGAFYIWNAETGVLVVRGVLGETVLGNSRSIASLRPVVEQYQTQ